MLQLWITPPVWVQTPLTTALVAITALISILAFERPLLIEKLIFYPYRMTRDKSWYRFLSGGLIHSNWLHLIFNLFVLWEFGRAVEIYYKLAFGGLGPVYFLGLYLSGIAMASSFDFFRHRDNPMYRALGASGAVSAVVFAGMLFSPMQQISFVFLPFIKMPIVVFGALYLAYSSYMGRRGNSNIGHYAHFWGGIWGIIYTLMLQPKIFNLFLAQLGLF